MGHANQTLFNIYNALGFFYNAGILLGMHNK